MEKKSYQDIKDIILSGGNIKINASDYKVSHIKDFAEFARQSSCKLILQNSRQLTTQDMIDISDKLPKNVTFEL